MSVRAATGSLVISVLMMCHVLASPVGVWHLTDVHVDPFYITGSDATKCYCETTASCSVTGQGCFMANISTGQVPAAKFGNSEGNCATPVALYESGLDFMQQQGPDSPFIYFTGMLATTCVLPLTAACSSASRILTVVNTRTTCLQLRHLYRRFRGGWSLVPVHSCNRRVGGRAADSGRNQL